MLIVEFAQYLDTQNIVNFQEAEGGDCFIEKLPQEPASAVALYSRGGFPADSKLGYANPTFQVVVRGEGQDPRAAEDRAQAIYSALHGLRNVQLPGGTWLVSCLGLQSAPTSIGEDENKRPQYSLNFVADIALATAQSDG